MHIYKTGSLISMTHPYSGISIPVYPNDFFFYFCFRITWGTIDYWNLIC